MPAAIRQRLDHHRRHRNLALTSGGLRGADLAPQGRALVDRDHFALKIDIIPAKSADLRGAHAGEDRRNEQRTPPAIGLGQDYLNLFLRRDVAPDGELTLISLLHIYPDRLRCVLCYQAPALRLAKDALEAD
jgi:hypothetical protein